MNTRRTTLAPIPATEATLPDNVLLVDDDRSVLDTLSVALTRAGLSVRIAANADEALRLAEEERFGALVTDKNLPGTNGLELMKKMKAKQPHCACLLITGYVSTASVLEALQLGASDYILKPFDSLQLVAQRVRRAIEEQRVAAERAQLAQTLHAMEHRLRSTEQESLRRQTELDLFQNVLELRVEESTRQVLRRFAQVESDLHAEQSRRDSTAATLLQLSQVCRVDAQEAGPGAAVLERVAGQLNELAQALRAGG